jgi:organic hydroperoxide reductase OsmC/OhrA
MSKKETHEFACRLTWTGGKLGGTTSYAAYSREYRVEFAGKPAFTGSAAPVFRGDPGLCNPEDLLVASLSGCHCLSYLALAALGGIHVVEYSDSAWGKLEKVDGVMRFTEVVLRPRVVIRSGASLERARALHEQAHHQCFIANSVNFPVRNEPEMVVAEAAE